MADPSPKMPAGYHRNHMSLPDQPEHQGGGVGGSDQLLSRNNRDPETNQHRFFLKKSKVPSHPSTPEGSRSLLPGGRLQVNARPLSF
jgi:hypothetical protein